MSTNAFTCPCCGAPIAYNGASGKLECASCGNHFDPEAMETLNSENETGSIRFDMPTETIGEQDADMQAYLCKNCGAELITETTTTATECPYCGSPTILPDRISGSVRPKLVIPFVITKEEARRKFEAYFKGKRLIPNVFLNSRNRIAEMRKLYVPYWLFDCDASANIVYNAQKRHNERKGDWEVTRTEYYIVRRSGGMRFENIPVDGSEKLDDRITESLEPYDLTGAVPFQSAILAGAMADHADVDAEKCEGRAIERVESSLSQAMRSTVNGYSAVTERSRSFNTEGGTATPVLLPVWLITTEKEGKTYTFAINGQTGKLTCDVPADKAKSFAWGGGVFAGVLGVAALVMALTGSLGSGTLLLAGIGALIVSLIVLGMLRGQLKQASRQSAASNYVKRDSFHLDIRNDHFLYAKTQRKKIEAETSRK